VQGGGEWIGRGRGSEGKGEGGGSSEADSRRKWSRGGDRGRVKEGGGVR